MVNSIVLFPLFNSLDGPDLLVAPTVTQLCGTNSVSLTDDLLKTPMMTIADLLESREVFVLSFDCKISSPLLLLLSGVSPFLLALSIVEMFWRCVGYCYGD